MNQAIPKDVLKKLSDLEATLVPKKGEVCVGPRALFVYALDYTRKLSSFVLSYIRFSLPLHVSNTNFLLLFLS